MIGWEGIEPRKVSEERDEKKSIEAGRIAFKVMNMGRKYAKADIKIIELAEYIENEIIKLGGEPAFPVCLSSDKQAAHYTALIDDKTIVGDVLKIDVGVHLDGYIGDCAITLDFCGEHEKLIEASEQALENMISMIRAGVKSNELGREVEKTIKGFGFQPIENLTGHLVERYSLHAGFSIPNIDLKSGFELEEGQIFALEPFASMGRGHVADGQCVGIFALDKKMPVRNQEARKIIEFVKRYKGLPFGERWLTNVVSGFPLKAALREISQRNIFHSYPVLVDSNLVSQAEKTIIVRKDSCEVITR